MEHALLICYLFNFIAGPTVNRDFQLEFSRILQRQVSLGCSLLIILGEIFMQLIIKRKLLVQYCLFDVYCKYRHAILSGRVDDFSFFDYSSPFCFLLLEFNCIFSTSYKILTDYVYYYCILIR